MQVTLAMLSMTRMSIDAFTVVVRQPITSSSSLSASAGKGFGKKPTPSSPTPSSVPKSSSSVSTENAGSGADNETPDFLTSIESSSSSAESKPSLDLNLDPSLTPDERQELILRKQFGLTKPGEKEGEEWVPRSQRKVPEPEKDVFSMIPAPILIAFDRFLKGGLAICTTAFMAAGVLITLEAWQHASGDTSLISPELDEFIVNIVEPNFTPGLLVLLGFSVTLGVFTIASGGSASSQYRE